jgi:tetratricopeptide (TPR) repeat protein
LLTLAPAVVGDSSPGLLRAIEQQPPVSLRHLRPDLPRDLVTVLETAMAKSPFERYLTAQHFADDLLRVLEGRPTLAKPPAWHTRVAKWAVRHHHLVTAAALIFLAACMSLGIGGWLIAQKSAVAEVSAEKAHKSFNALRDSMERTYTETVEEMKDIPGTEVLRRKLLTDLLGYYRQFVDEFRSDRTLHADVATALLRLGTLHRELGEPDAARDRLREASALYRSLFDSDPDSLEYRRQQAICAAQLGRVLAQLGETREAEASAREAVALQQTLLKTHPANPVVSAELAASRSELALLLAETGRRDEAEKLLDEARLQLLELTRAEPRELKYQKLLAATYNNLCSVIAGRDPAAAARLYKLSLDVQKGLLAARSEPLPPGGQLAVTYSNLGKSLAHANQLNEAVEAYVQAIDIQRRLIAVAPSHRVYLRDLGISLNNLGLAQMKLGLLKEAEGSFREAIGWQQDLIEQAPKDANAAHELGGTYNNLATLLQSFPDMQAIDAAFERAIAYQRQALQAAPEVEKYREFLDNHLRNYSAWLRNSRRDEQGLAAALERRILWSGNARKLVLVASDLADAALDLAEKGNRQGVARRYADAAVETLGLAQNAGLAQSHGVTVQQLLARQPFSSLAQVKSPTD